jgi:hypothetical protein
MTGDRSEAEMAAIVTYYLTPPTKAEVGRGFSTPASPCAERMHIPSCGAPRTRILTAAFEQTFPRSAPSALEKLLLRLPLVN